MNITCCICAELFIPSDDVFFTPCGHFFHYPCVSHWLERSKTCPHCRAKVTNKSIQRAYFNFTNTDTIESDSTVLISKIDSLKLQILLKEQDLKKYGEDNVKLTQQTAGLRAEVRKLEVEIEKHRSVNYAYKEQMKYLKEQCAGAEAAANEVVRLTKKLQEYRSVEMLICGSQDEVDRMLNGTQDQTSLITYICVMKREMESNVQRRKELRTRVRKLEQEIITMKSDQDCLLRQEAKCRQLEEDLAHSENEKKSLEKKLREVTRHLSSKRKTQSEDIDRFISESPAPERLKIFKDHETISEASNSVVMMSPDLFSSPSADHERKDSPERLTESKQKENSPKLSPKVKSTAKSPYLAVKSRGAFSISALSQQKSRPESSSSGLSILSKKPRIVPSKLGEKNTEMHYDGFGGHSKVDNYPSPIVRFKPKVLKNNLMSVKVKRRKVNSDGTKKKLDEYFVDLT